MPRITVRLKEISVQKKSFSHESKCMVVFDVKFGGCIFGFLFTFLVSIGIIALLLVSWEYDVLTYMDMHITLLAAQTNRGKQGLPMETMRIF